MYATGWIKRGPVGLIGSTKSDARETVSHLVADLREGIGLRPVVEGSEDDADVLALLAERGVEVTTWQGWELLEAHERALGEAEGRERIKVVPREEMVAISRAGAPVGAGE